MGQKEKLTQLSCSLEKPSKSSFDENLVRPIFGLTKFFLFY